MLGACGNDAPDSAIGDAAEPSRAAGPAEVIAEEESGRRSLDLTVYSPAVGAEVPVLLLLPRGWSPQSAERFPLLLLLHGARGDYGDWTQYTDVEDLVADEDVIVAMPGGGPVGFYSDWSDGPGWETFHVEELPALLEKDYAASDQRAVAGLSMGGLGALGYAARHPDVFGAAASFSGVADTRDPDAIDMIENAFTSNAEELADLWGDPAADEQTWKEHNPLELAQSLADIPLFLSVGSGEVGPLDPESAEPDWAEAQLYEENLALRDALEEADAEATFDFYGPGTHTWPYWDRQLHSAFPTLMRAIGAL